MSYPRQPGSVCSVTFVRSAPNAVAPSVDVITDVRRRALDRLLAMDPLVNAVVVSRLAAYRTLDPSRLGGVMLGVRDDHRDQLAAAAFNGGNLLPVGGDESCWKALAGRVSAVPRMCTSIVGRADAVGTMWRLLEPRWGPARTVRDDQPLLVLGRHEPIAVDADPRVRIMQPSDIDRYLPAAAAMFTEELGVSPFSGRAGTSYRRRVESLLSSGRAFGIVDDHGRMAFKADVGALTADTCQLQGVWVRPDLRGHGLGAAGLAGVIRHALRLAPTASLYVNAFNTAARRMYARLGMRPVCSLATVLF